MFRSVTISAFFVHKKWNSTVFPFKLQNNIHYSLLWNCLFIRLFCFSNFWFLHLYQIWGNNNNVIVPVFEGNSVISYSPSQVTITCLTVIGPWLNYKGCKKNHKCPKIKYYCLFNTEIMVMLYEFLLEQQF